MKKIQSSNQSHLKLIKGTCEACGTFSDILDHKFNDKLYCPNCFIEKIEAKIFETIIHYNMLSPEDHVIVGLSGGKDSTTLLFNLIKLSEKKLFSSISALIIDEGIEDYRAKSIADAISFCKEHDVPIKIISFKEVVSKSLDEINTFFQNREDRRYTCNYCATIRRRLLNEGAKELGGTVLAMGHNLTDFTETFLMNILYNRLHLIGSQYLFKKEPLSIREHFIRKINPLLLIPEEEIYLYAKIKNLKFYPSHCPYRETDPILRKRVLTFIQKMKEKTPNIEYKLFESFSELSKKLYESFPKKESNNCKKCGYPSGSSQFCTFCRLTNLLEG